MSDAEYETIEAVWVSKTGKCPECAGEGKTVAQVSAANGTTYRQCFKCKGTGKAQECGIR